MKKIYLVSISILAYCSIIAQPNSGGFPLGLGKKESLPEPAAFKLSPINNQELLAEDANWQAHGEKSLRFGKDVPVDISPATHGTTSILSNGIRLWRLLIKSNGATNINLIFDHYDVPKGAKMFVYNLDGSQIIGAFTEANENKVGNFATMPVQGDQVILEYSEPASVAGQGLIHLSYIIHGYRDFNKSFKDFNTSGACNNNVVCPEGNPWEQQIRSSVVLLTSNNSRYCSGAAVDNTLHDGTPYILTANHCGPGTTDIFLFNYKSPTCTPTTDGPTTDIVQGCILRANNGGSDFFLVELASEIPAEYVAFLSGWSRQDVPPAQAICIHHPDGDVEKISFNNDATVIGTMSGADCWNIPTWEDGTTEPGSSGSPLYNENKQIIGQLFGGDATCSNNVNDFFGRFVTSWDGASAATRLKDWLDPNNSDSMSLNGMESSVPALGLDARMQSIVSPVENYCNESSFTPIVRVRNTGSTTLTSFSLTYQFAGSTIQIYDWTGTLAFNQVADISLPAQTIGAGNNQIFTATVVSANGTTDEQANNNTLSISVNNRVGAAYNFQLISDNYPQETSWYVVDVSSNAIMAEQTLGSVAQGTTNTNLCLPNGCYTLVINDDYGDGICCGFQTGNGSFTLFDGAGISLGTGGQFTTSDSISFCVQNVSISEIPNEMLIQVMPNPANDIIRIRLPEAFFNDMPVAELYSVTGQRIMQMNIQSTIQTLDAQTLSNGVYLLRVVGKTRMASQLLIIQH